MATNTLTSPELLEAWETYVSSDPYGGRELPGLPVFLNSKGQGDYYDDGHTRRFGASIIYLGIRKNEQLEITEEKQAVRLDWVSTTPSEDLSGMVLGLAKKFDQDGWQHESFTDSEIMRNGELFVAAANGRMRVAGPIGEIATNPLIEELARQTVVQDTDKIQYGYAQALTGYIDGLRNHSAEHNYQRVA